MRVPQELHPPLFSATKHSSILLSIDAEQCCMNLTLLEILSQPRMSVRYVGLLQDLGILSILKVRAHMAGRRLTAGHQHPLSRLT